IRGHSHNMNRILILLVYLASRCAFAQEQPPLLAQEPALSQTQIVFMVAGDLWIVPRTGGEAKRLTAGAGVESSPSFSPDGKWVAFTGQYDGNTDVFVVSSGGGVRSEEHTSELQSLTNLVCR